MSSVADDGGRSLPLFMSRLDTAARLRAVVVVVGGTGLHLNLDGKRHRSLNLD